MIPNATSRGPKGSTIYLYKTESYQTYSHVNTPTAAVTYGSGQKPVITSSPNTNFAISRGPNTLSCTAMFVANAKVIIIETQMQGNGCYRGNGFAERQGNPTHMPAIAQ